MAIFTVQLKISCRIMTFLTYNLSITGLMAITALSFDRYFAVRYPFAYQSKVTKQIVYFLNLFVSMYTAALFFPLLVGKKWVICFGDFGIPSGVNWRKIPLAYVYSMALLAFVVPGVILIFTNIYVFTVARKQY